MYTLMIVARILIQHLTLAHQKSVELLRNRLVPLENVNRAVPVVEAIQT